MEGASASHVTVSRQGQPHLSVFDLAPFTHTGISNTDDLEFSDDDNFQTPQPHLSQFFLAKPDNMENERTLSIAKGIAQRKLLTGTLQAENSSTSTSHASARPPTASSRPRTTPLSRSASQRVRTQNLNSEHAKE